MARGDRNNPLKLAHGDIVIATAISHYTHKGAEGKQSQSIGDMLLVNHPHSDGNVQGFSLMPGSVGLGTSLRADTYRRARPSDKHYVMTVHEWDRYQPERFIRWLYNINFAHQLLFAALMAMSLIKEFA